MVKATCAGCVDDAGDGIDGAQRENSKVDGVQAHVSSEDSEERGEHRPEEEVAPGEEAALEESRADEQDGGACHQGLPGGPIRLAGDPRRLRRLFPSHAQRPFRLARLAEGYAIKPLTEAGVPAMVRFGDPHETTSIFPRGLT